MTHPFELLILDDDRETAEMTSELLGIYFPEAAIRVAFSGEEAVKLSQQKRPVVAVFDLEMAGMGGAAAARELRLVWPEIPPLLIALSGNLLKLDVLRHGGPFNHLLSKPVDIPALVRLVGSQV